MAKNDSVDEGALSQENSSEELALRDRDAPLTHRGASEYQTSDLSLFHFGSTLVTSGQFWIVDQRACSLFIASELFRARSHLSDQSFICFLVKCSITGWSAMCESC